MACSNHHQTSREQLVKRLRTRKERRINHYLPKTTQQHHVINTAKHEGSALLRRLSGVPEQYVVSLVVGDVFGREEDVRLSEVSGISRARVGLLPSALSRLVEGVQTRVRAAVATTSFIGSSEEENERRLFSIPPISLSSVKVHTISINITARQAN